MMITKTDDFFEVRGTPKPIWNIDYLDQDNQLHTFTSAQHDALEALEIFVNSEANFRIVDIYQKGVFTPRMVVPRTHLT